MANNLFDFSTNAPDQESQDSSNLNSSASSERDLNDSSETSLKSSESNETTSTHSKSTIQEHDVNPTSHPHSEMEGVNDSSTLLTAEELNHIAGNYNPEENALISQEFQLKQDQEAPTERSPSQKGSVRLFAVTGSIGVTLLAIATVWTGFLAPKSPVEKAKREKPEDAPTVAATPDQTAELKSQLAFAEQQRRLEESNQPKPEAPTSKTKKRTNSRESRTPRARMVVDRSARRPAPIPQRIASPSRATAPIRTPPPAQTKPEKPVDPFKTWDQLAQLGQDQADGVNNSPNATNTVTNLSSTEATAAATNPAIQPDVSTSSQLDMPATTSSDYGQTTIQTATIGDPPSPSNDLTQGEYGILNHQKVSQANSAIPSDESISGNNTIAVEETNPLDETIATDDSTSVDETDFIDSTTVAIDSDTSNPDSTDADSSTAQSTTSNGSASSTDLDSSETTTPVFDAPASAASEVTEPANSSPEVEVSKAKSLSPPSSATYQPKEVALGSSASGTVSVPLVWGQNGKTPLSERGAIELNEPLLAKDGSVALPAGTKLITQTILVSNVPQTSVIAVIRNRGGEIQQYPLPPNILVVRSGDGEPLLGKNINDVNPSLLKGDDFLVGILGGLGQLGEVLNRDRTESSSTFSGNGISQTITNRSRDPNVVGAILQGALQPATERMKQRIAAREQEQQRRRENLPNIAVVPKGTTVMITAQNILRVNP